MEDNEQVQRLSLGQDEKVFVNHGHMRVMFVAKTREENRKLLEGLFDAMGVWFAENADNLAGEPVMDGDTFEIATEDVIFDGLGRTGTTENDIPDTFPEEWSE